MGAGSSRAMQQAIPPPNFPFSAPAGLSEEECWSSIASAQRLLRQQQQEGTTYSASGVPMPIPSSGPTSLPLPRKQETPASGHIFQEISYEGAWKLLKYDFEQYTCMQQDETNVP